MINDWNPYQTPEAAPPAPARRRLNPWLSMWTQPRATIRQIVEDDPERRVELLAMLSGISFALSPVMGRGDANVPGWGALLFDIVMTVLVGGLIGVFGLYIGAALLRWTGSWFGGTATLRDLRAAMAWSNLLTVWALPLTALQFVLLSTGLVTAGPERLNASPALGYLYLGTVALRGLIWIWATEVLVKATGEVQGFSAWRALASALLALFVVVGLLVAAALLLFSR